MGRRLARLALLTALACTPKPADAPAPAPSPPSAFVESEPSAIVSSSSTNTELSVVLPDDLFVHVRAEPVRVDDGWGVHFELAFIHRGSDGVFDLGREPILSSTVSVLHADGSGHGSGGGCTYGSRMHGNKDTPLAPGERFETRYEWHEGVRADQRLELNLRGCDLRRPNGDSIPGELARLEAVVDRNGQLTRFELLPSDAQ